MDFGTNQERETYERMLEKHSIPVTEYWPEAEWIWSGPDKGYTCSACGSRCLLNYESDWCQSDCCPHCGRKMKKVADRVKVRAAGGGWQND